MSFPYVVVFLVLLGTYMVYSVWAELDARYPIVAGLVLLVAAAAVDAAGDLATANVLAEYAFFLVGAGVVLLLIDRARESRKEAASGSAPPQGEPAQSAGEREGTTDDPLHGVQEEPVPIVDAPGQHDQDDV